SKEDEREQCAYFLDTFLESLKETDMKKVSAEANEKMYDLLSEMTFSRAKNGFMPGETATFIFSLKEVILKTLSEEITDAGLLYQESMELDGYVDNLSISTFEIFIRGREDVILRQTDEMTEISTPVIRVWDGILALPIIGTLDSSRTQTVMENLLQEIVETESAIAILDISGVPSVDSMVAQHLIKTVSATRLMGAECIISGIRPEIAQTIVHLGIDLSGILTKATMADALKSAFMILRLEVAKKN
ncbi:MAG: STAS domain-containing protein, partial [Bacteroidia bacterium]